MVVKVIIIFNNESEYSFLSQGVDAIVRRKGFVGFFILGSWASTEIVTQLQVPSEYWPSRSYFPACIDSQGRAFGKNQFLRFNFDGKFYWYSWEHLSVIFSFVYFLGNY